MATAASIIQKKAKALSTAMNAAIKTKRDKKLAELKKNGEPDPEAKVAKVRFQVSKDPATLSRTPQKQAELIQIGNSWTCGSAHMVDKARHVQAYFTMPGKSEKWRGAEKTPWGTGDEFFMTFSEFSAEWTKQLKSQDLRNHLGKKAFNKNDAWHVELPDGKMLKDDPRVKECLVHYSKITRIDGKEPFLGFENEKTWKPLVAPYIKAAEKEKEALDKKKRLEEMKKVKFEGSAAGKQKLISKVSKSQTKTGKPFDDIDVVGPWDTGGRTVKKVLGSCGVQWDSLPRDLFEFLGIAETSGYDVKLSCTIEYNLVTYDNLSQSFITKLTPSCTLVYNTIAARFLGMSVDVVSEVKLGKSDKVPVGKVVFDFVLTNPINQSKGSITMNVSGGKVQTKAKIK